MRNLRSTIAAAVTAALVTTPASPGQELARSPVDAKWRTLQKANRATRAAILDDLRRDAVAAGKRGVHLLGHVEEFHSQSFAFAIAELGPAGFDALLAAAANPESPARHLGLEGALFYASRYFDRDPDEEGRRRRLQDALVAGLDAADEEMMRQVDLGIGYLGTRHHELLEARLTEPAPIGPRAALHLRTRPRAPLPAIVAALEDPLRSVRTDAIDTLLQRDRKRGQAAVRAQLAAKDSNDRRAAITTLAAWRYPEWSATERELLMTYVTTALPPPLDEDWFEDLATRKRILESAANRVTKEPELTPAYLPLLLGGLDLPESDAGWICYRVDELRAIALRALSRGFEQLPESDRRGVVRRLRKLAARDELALPLLEVVFDIQLDLAPPSADERLIWDARYRRAAERASHVQQGRRFSFYAANALAAVYDAIGRLGHPSSAEWLRDRVLRGPGARGAAMGALLRIAGDDPATMRELRQLLARDPGPWPHDEVLAAAVADHGPGALWLVQVLLDRIPDKLPNHANEILAAIGRLGKACNAADRKSLREELEGRLEPKSSSTFQAIARAIATIDPEAALAYRGQGAIGQRLFSAALDLHPELLARDLDSPDPQHRSYAQQYYRSRTRNPKVLATVAEILKRPRLHQPERLFYAVATMGPGPELLPSLERWLPRERAALRAIVAVGERAVPTLARALPKLPFFPVQELQPLGPAAGPLLPMLLEHPNDQVRGMTAHLLPFFGRPGIAEMRRRRVAEREIGEHLTAVLVTGRAHLEARIAAADELLLMPHSLDLGDFELSPRAPARLASRVLLLQGNRASSGEGATTALLDTLGSPEPHLRAFALRRLRDHPDRERVLRYVHWLRQDEDPAVQRALRAFDGR